MRCIFCGYVFDEKQGSKVCADCPLSKSCSMIRCPNCGYEMLPQPKLLKSLKKLFKKEVKNEHK